MRLTHLAACALLVGLGTGCNTAVGNYFANRARDFGECWRAEIGAGGIGGGVKAMGVVHLGFGGDLGMMIGGWDYGEVVAFDIAKDGRGGMGGGGRLDGFFGVHAEVARRVDHVCFGLLPALFSLVKHEGTGNPVAGWLWTVSDSPRTRWARIHAFDVEVTACAGLSVHLGFSPGEFVDFLAGWFGLDLAGDDRALADPVAE